MVEKELQNILNKTTISRGFDRIIGNYLGALGLFVLLDKQKEEGGRKNIKVEYDDLVKHDYNKTDMIATNVPYIPIKNNISKTWI